MEKLSISVVLLFFSILFFHANGNPTQSENTEGTLQADVPTPTEVKEWYKELEQKRLITRRIKVFFHADSVSSDPNQVPIAKNNISTFIPSWFGLTEALDYPLTVTPDRNSEHLGYGQGFFLASSKQEFSAFISMNLVLNRYPNSIITLLGRDSFNDEYREVAIVGGTGEFRLATGSATMHSYYHEPGFAIVELNLFVRYYVSPLSNKGADTA